MFFTQTTTQTLKHALKFYQTQKVFYAKKPIPYQKSHWVGGQLYCEEFEETIPEHRHIFYDMRGIMTCVLWSEGGVYWNDFDFKVWEAKRLKGLNEDGVKQTNSLE